MKRDRRRVDHEHTADSFIEEDITDVDQLLDDFISEKNRENEERKEKLDEATAEEGRLFECVKTLVQLHQPVARIAATKKSASVRRTESTNLMSLTTTTTGRNCQR